MPTKLSDSELEEIAKIHINIFQDDLLPQLGIKYLMSFYKFISKSKKEKIFIIRNKKRIIGTCIISLEADTILFRTIKGTLFQFLKSCTTSFIKNNKFRKYLLNLFFLKNTAISHTPEIAYIFTDKLFQKKGVAKKLLDKVKVHLHKEGYSTCNVKTLNNSTNKAIDFYKINEFKRDTTFSYAGNDYLYMRVDLNV